MKIRTYIVIALTLLGLTALVYYPVVKGPFFYDDKYKIVDNPHIRDLSNLGDYFLSQKPIASVKWVGFLYRPVLAVWLAMLYSVGGLDPRFFHWVSLLLHALNSMLVILLAHRLLEGAPNRILPAFAAGAVFLLHTANVEAVCWISTQGALLALSLGLISILVGLSGRGYISAAIAGILCLLASLSYESVIGLPVFYLLIIYVRGGKRGLKERFKPLISLALAFAVLVALREVIAGHNSFMGLWGNSLSYHLSVMAYALMTSLRVTFFPNVVKIEYVPYLWISPFEPRSLFYMAASAAVIIAFFLAVWRRSPWSIPFAGWFLFYLPASNLLPYDAIFADRFLYMPDVGIALAAGILIQKFGKKAALLCAVAILSFGLLSRERSEIWSQPMRLWAITMKAYPALVRIRGTEADSRIGHLKARLLTMNGVIHLDSGNVQFALNEFTEAVKADPSDFEPRFNRGAALDRLGRPEEAVKEYSAASTLTPPTPELEFALYDNLGSALASMHRYDEAIAEYKLALEKNPSSSVTHSNLATALIETGRYNEAEAELITALRYTPNSDVGMINLASLYVRMGKTQEAVRLMEIVADRSPDSPLVMKNLAITYLKAGMKDKAKIAFERFLQLYPAARGTPLHEQFLKEWTADRSQ